MRLDGEGTLLRIFIGEADRVDRHPLHEAILLAARKSGLAGATVLRGVEGFGAASVIHTAKILRMSEDLPIVVEIIDTPERIDAFVTVVDDLIGRARCGAMMTTERIRVIRHTPGDASGQA